MLVLCSLVAVGIFLYLSSIVNCAFLLLMDVLLALVLIASIFVE